MRLELFQDGRLIVSIEPVGNMVSGDFTVLPKSLATNCKLNPESFDDLFFECLKEKRTHEEAYNQAEEIHEQFFGARKYTGFETFRISKSNRLNK